MNIILFGPPGAGKGTQAKHIVKKYNYFQLSTGDLLRDEITKKTELSEKISKLIDQGEFVTDEIVEDLIIKIINNENYKNRIIFDGYPRNISQVKKLEKILENANQKIDKILYLDVSKDNILKRISGRILCQKCNEILNEFTNKEDLINHKCGTEYFKKRADDNDKTIVKRYDTYMEVTKPVLDYYKSNPNFIKIDGTLKIDEISGKIEEILNV